MEYLSSNFEFRMKRAFYDTKPNLNCFFKCAYSLNNNIYDIKCSIKKYIIIRHKKKERKNTSSFIVS